MQLILITLTNVMAIFSFKIQAKLSAENIRVYKHDITTVTIERQ